MQWNLLLLILSSLLASLVEMFGISLIIPMFDLINNPDSNNSEITQYFKNFFLFLGINLSLPNLLIFIILSFSLKAFLIFFIDFIQSWTVIKINRTVQIKMVELIENMDFRYITKKRTGFYVNLLGREINKFSNALKNFSSTIVQVISLLAFFSTVFFFNSEIFIIAFFILIIFPILIKKLINLTRTYSGENVDINSSTQSSLIELLNNYTYVKSTNFSRKLNLQIIDKLKRLASLTIRSNVISSFLGVIKEPIGIIIIATLVYYKVIIGNQSLEEIIVLSLLLYRTVHKNIEIFNLWQRVNIDIASVFLVEKNLINLNQNQEINRGKKNIKSFETIDFNKVHFSYSNEKNLSNLNFSIKKNTTTGIVGLSGSGKSSLIYLLTKLLRPSSGKILMDNIDYEKINNLSLRNLFGYISQEVSLFHGTIEDNISLYENKKKTLQYKRKISDAMNKAGCSELIDRLDEFIGDSVKTLSGGQRQRVAIARELFRNTKILLFDEATSSLDSFSENIINETINNLKGKKTILVISHKISTIKNCDRIIVLSNGKIIQEGKFNSLWKNKNGLFRKLCNKQNLKKS